ncbi:MAG TPA: SRPBCC domain-containing protein [Polyangia bacterium]
MSTPVSRSDAKVVIERTYQADIEDVWALWTTKEGFESWWGPQGFRAEVQEIEARVGGVLRYEMIADSPETIAALAKMGRPRSHPTNSRFTELQPRSRLVITSAIDFIPGVAPYESNIAVDLSAAGGRVRMVVTLDPMHTDEVTKMQTEGFTSQLTKLDTRFDR